MSALRSDAWGSVMDASPCVLRVQQGESCVTVQLCGRATMNQALALRRYGEERIQQGLAELRLDLRHCTHLDSTMFGTLLCLKRSMDRRGQGAVLLVSPSADCARLLKQMGIDGMLPAISAEEPDEHDWSPLLVEKQDSRAFKRHILECHDELARAGGTGSDQFRMAVECLSKEV